MKKYMFAISLLLSSALFAADRPAKKDRCFVSESVEKLVGSVARDIKDEKIREMFVACYPNTLDTTVKFDRDNQDTFVITGDINAMWLRDSGAQLFPYVSLMFLHKS